MDFLFYKENFQKKKVKEFSVKIPQQPLVSVCVQTYQHVNYIIDCLEGILMQETSFPIEILLGEDDSDDGTREICMEYAKKHPDKIRFFLHHRENNIKINGFPSGRFNFIYNLFSAKGKYIAICEGDDYWTDPFKLQKQVEFLEANSEYGGCFHNTMIINENDVSPVLKAWRTYSKETFLLEDTISEIALFHTSSFVFKSKLLFLPEWISNVQSGDMALFALIASKGPLHRIDNFMSVYRKNESGITNTITLKDYHKNRIKLLEYFKEAFSEEVHYKIMKVISNHKHGLSKLKKDTFKTRLLKILKFR